MSNSGSSDDSREDAPSGGASAVLGYVFFRGLFLFAAGYQVGFWPLLLLLGAVGVPLGPADLATWIVRFAGLIVGTWVAALGWTATRNAKASRAA